MVFDDRLDGFTKKKTRSLPDSSSAFLASARLRSPLESKRAIFRSDRTCRTASSR